MNGVHLLDQHFLWIALDNCQPMIQLLPLFLQVQQTPIHGRTHREEGVVGKEGCLLYAVKHIVDVFGVSLKV